MVASQQPWETVQVLLISPEAQTRNDLGQVNLAKQAKLSFVCMIQLVSLLRIFKAGSVLILIGSISQ